MAELEKKKLLKSFGIKAGITFIVWMILYYGFIIPDGRPNHFLAQQV